MLLPSDYRLHDPPRQSPLRAARVARPSPTLSRPAAEMTLPSLKAFSPSRPQPLPARFPTLSRHYHGWHVGNPRNRFNPSPPSLAGLWEMMQDPTCCEIEETLLLSLYRSLVQWMRRRWIRKQTPGCGAWKSWPSRHVGWQTPNARTVVRTASSVPRNPTTMRLVRGQSTRASFAQRRSPGQVHCASIPIVVSCLLLEQVAVLILSRYWRTTIRLQGVILSTSLLCAV